VRRASTFGIVSLVAGFVMYLALGFISLSSYDQVAKPGWLVALSLVAVALVVAGLLTLVSGAIAVSRGRR
jgi:uncharacterized membrane-anchored protein